MKLPYSPERAIKIFLKNVFPEPNTGCWLWNGPLTTSGYANFYYRPQKLYIGHRFSYPFGENQHSAKLT